MDITIHSSLLPHDDPIASLAFYRDALGFEVRADVEYGGMHWITVGPTDQPGTSDRAAVRDPRRRLPGPLWQPDPNPGAALSRPAITGGQALRVDRRTEVLRNG
jgi:catechol 2,3-dioxygenase-like lactoylglutathione lyase family enzyme